MSLTAFVQCRIMAPLRALLMQGIAPRRLALCVAIGIVVGNIPLFGVSTVLCAAIALAFRLNLPAIQCAQAAMAPTQLLLIVPFARLGERIVHAPTEPLSLRATIGSFASLAGGAGHAAAVLRNAMMHAGLAWAVVAPGAVLLIYLVLAPVFVRAAGRRAGGDAQGSL